MTSKCIGRFTEALATSLMRWLVFLTVMAASSARAVRDPPAIWIGQGGELHSGGSLHNPRPIHRIVDRHHRVWDCWDRLEDVPRGRYRSVSYRVTYVGGRRRGFYCGTNDVKRKEP